MDGQVRVKHVVEGWELTLLPEKVQWVGCHGHCTPVCYLDSNGTKVLLIEGEGARYYNDVMGYRVLEVYHV